MQSVQDKCKEFNLKNKSKTDALKNIVVDEKHELLLCVPYKCGASTHLTLLARNSDAYLNNEIPEAERNKMLRSLYSETNRRRFGLKMLSEFPAEKRQEVLRDYFKVSVVRHPFARFSSMFYNRVAIFNAQTQKYECPKNNNIGKELTKLMNTKPYARNCSLAVFIDLFLSNSTEWLRNPHLTPMHVWCGTCDINYDYIIRLETGDDDQRYVMKNYVNENFDKTLRINGRPDKSNDARQPFERKLPEYDDVSDDQIKTLIEIYGLDLDIFGYKIERSRQENGLLTKCSIENSKSSPCC